MTDRPAAGAATRPALPWGDSPGGHVLVLLCLGSLLYAVVGRLVDGRSFVLDQFNRMTVIGEPHAATLVGVGLFGLACAAAAFGVLRVDRQRCRLTWANVALVGLVGWWSVTTFLIPRDTTGLVTRLVSLAALLLVVGVVAAPPTMTTIARLNTLRDLFCAATLMYAVAAPLVAQVPCRPDKCGLFGTMVVGFFFQENSTPAAIVGLLPLAALSRTRSRVVFSFALAVVNILASGSRTGMVSAAIALVFVVVARWTWRAGRDDLRIPLVLRSIPLAVTAVSIWLFVTAEPEALTGRGVIYAANREALGRGASLLYGVPWDTVPLATDGTLVSDHGQASHLLARAGLVGLLLWVGYLVALTRQWHADRQRIVALGIVLSTSVGVVTESPFELNARSIGLVALLLLAGLDTAGPAAEREAADRRRWRARGEAPGRAALLRAPWRTRTGALLLVSLAAVAGYAVLGRWAPMGQARAVVVFAGPAQGPSEALEAQYLTTSKVASYLALVDAPTTARAVADRLGGGVTPEDVQDAIIVTHAPGRPQLTITATATEQGEAVRYAQAMVGYLGSLSERLEFQSLDAPGQQHLVSWGVAPLADVAVDPRWRGALFGGWIALAVLLLLPSTRHPARRRTRRGAAVAGPDRRPVGPGLRGLGDG